MADSNNDTRLTDPRSGDYWQRLLAEIASDAGGPPRGERPHGRVLRAKLGYNPNSSSVGSVVSVLMWSATFSAVALNTLAAVLRRHRRDTGGEAPSSDGAEADSLADAGPR